MENDRKGNLYPELNKREVELNLKKKGISRDKLSTHNFRMNSNMELKYLIYTQLIILLQNNEAKIIN